MATYQRSQNSCNTRSPWNGAGLGGHIRRGRRPSNYVYVGTMLRALMAGRPYTFTAKRYTFPYTRMRKELLVRIVAMLTRMIEIGNQVREGDVVYVNENGNEGQSAQPEGAGDSQ
jgi:hypothetical protein